MGTSTPVSMNYCVDSRMQIMRTYPNVLILRLRMPVSDDLHPRNFVTKISQYERVVDIPNVGTGYQS